MTLDEAIKHADEVAVECGTCAGEHRQLANWLRELKQRREASVPKTCATCREAEAPCDQASGDACTSWQAPSALPTPSDKE